MVYSIFQIVCEINDIGQLTISKSCQIFSKPFNNIFLISFIRLLSCHLFHLFANIENLVEKGFMKTISR